MWILMWSRINIKYSSVSLTALCASISLLFVTYTHIIRHIIYTQRQGWWTLSPKYGGAKFIAENLPNSTSDPPVINMGAEA